MKKNILIVLCSGAFAFTGCNKFLTEDPKSLISNTTYYKTSADAISAVNGVYAATRADVRGNIDPIWIAESTTDDITAAGTTVPSRIEIDNVNYTSQTTYIQNTWNTAYNVINRANNVLANVDSTKILPSLVRRVYGECRFLRAMYYLRLVQFFGDVPLVLTTPSNDNLFPPRTPSVNVYNQIISDLQYAEVNLDDKYAYADPQNGGRATKAAAKTMLGYTYLVMAGYPLNDAPKYQLAADKLNEVMTNKAAYGCDLMPSYAGIFDITKKPLNTEMIFSYRATNGLPSTVLGGNQLHYWYYTFTALAPTNEVINTLYETADLRKPVSMARKGSGTSFVSITSTLPADLTKQAIVNKYIDIANNGADANNDFPILRYADVLMMRAEALIEIGGTANLNSALALVNQVRTAHGGTGIPVLTYTTQDDLRQKLRLERRREFLFEGKRWYDLVRWNIFVPVMRAHLAAQKGLPISNFDYVTKNQMLLPLPYSDFVANPNLRPQNDGY